MSIGAILGMAAVLLLIIAVGILSGRRVKSGKDFLSGGGTAGSWIVCGTIMGSLVSSQATIGTAQLAFQYGFSAWWFTLGAGIGCLILAIVFVRPLRASGCITETQIIASQYGAPAGDISSVLCSVGIFISVLAQVVACAGLVSTLFPSVPLMVVVGSSIALMCIYVIFGGAWGAGIGGVMKLLLLYSSMVVSLLIILVQSSGFSGVRDGLSQMLLGSGVGVVSDLSSEADISARFFSLVSRGPMKDIGSGVSLLLGVLSTQTYAQAIWSAKSDKKARTGALLSAFLIPPVGIAGTFVGLFMRGHYITQAEVSALAAAGVQTDGIPVLANTIQVFPTFVLEYLPPVFAGIVLGTLLITIIGGGAGLSLGMATILVKDVCKRFSPKALSVKGELRLTRGIIAGILCVAAVIAVTVPNATINDLGFLSMGLRGSVIFVPLCCALFGKRRFCSKWVLAAIIFAPIAVLVAKILKSAVDPLFVGISVSLGLCLIGLVIPQSRKLTGP